MILSCWRQAFTSGAVELRDDDAEDDEASGGAEQEQQKEDEERMDVNSAAKKKPRDIQPTGRVVGVVKRNWRASVRFFSLLPSPKRQKGS